MDSKILQDITVRIDKLSIYELRQVARAVGVHRPADGKKSRIMGAILEIAQGITAPEPQSSRGAPPKSQVFDERLVADIKTCREYYLALKNGDEAEEPVVMQVSDSGAHFSGEELQLKGYLETDGANGWLRNNSAQPVFVSELFINRLGLREGDLIECKAQRPNNNRSACLTGVVSVNGVACSEISNRAQFSQLTRIYPQTNAKTAHAKEDAAGRIIDMFAPVALGQRAFIVGPRKSGKTTLLKSIGAGISLNYPRLTVLCVLLDESPESVTDFKRTLPDIRLFYTTFDMPAENHIRTVRLAVEHAKRLTESGKEVVVLFDGITRFVRAYRNTGKEGALEALKKLLFAACNAEEGGSLTLISTISQADTDGEIYGEVMGLANMCVVLSQELAARRIFPAIDVKASFADGEERLLTADEIKAAYNIRAKLGGELTAENIINLFKSTGDNGEIVNTFKN